MLGVPIDTEEYAVKRTVGAVRDEGAEWLARCLAGCQTSRKQSSLPPNPSDGERSTSNSAPWTRVRPSTHEKGGQRGTDSV